MVDFTVDTHVLVSRAVCNQANAHYIAHFIGCYMALLSDSPLPGTLGRKPFRVFQQFFKELLNSPIKLTIKRYARLFDELSRNGYLSGSESITGPFIEGFLGTPVFKEYHTFYRTGDSEVMAYLLTFCRFGKKMSYVDPDLHAIAFRDWLAVEDELSCLQLPSDLGDLSTVIRALLPPLDTTSWLPTFGPGAVADNGVRGVIAKACNLDFDPAVDRAIHSPYFKTRGDDGCAIVPTLSSLLPDEDRWRKESRHTSKVAELRFVPKDVSKSRSICMEPNTIMYFQQVVLEWLRHSISSGPLRNFIFLQDQGVNQQAALHGSTYGSIDTLDLSSASDRVSYDLVRRVFPREYLYYLTATRTSRVRTPSGEVIRVRKFAPMGSAVCFPVQCILFAAVIVYATMLHDRFRHGKPFECRVVRDEADVLRFLANHVTRNHSPDTPFGEKYERFLVFGDDLICDSRVTDKVTSVLTSLGFVLNGDKSFRGSQAFRESCGIFCFDGRDVTPFTYKVKSYGAWLTPVAYASMIEACNNAFDHGLLNLRSAFIRILRFYPLRQNRGSRARGRWNPVPFVSERDEFGIFVQDAKNHHLKRRWNLDYQRDEVCCEVPSVVKWRKPHSSQVQTLDHYLYLKYWRARYLSHTVPDFVFGMTRYRPEETGLVRRWIPSR